MNYNDIKLSIYESFDNGEIDKMEKDILLKSLMNDNTLASGSAEPTYENTYDRLMSEIDSLC